MSPNLSYGNGKTTNTYNKKKKPQKIIDYKTMNKNFNKYFKYYTIW